MVKLYNYSVRILKKKHRLESKNLMVGTRTIPDKNGRDNKQVNRKWYWNIWIMRWYQYVITSAYSVTNFRSASVRIFLVPSPTTNELKVHHGSIYLLIYPLYYGNSENGNLLRHKLKDRSEFQERRLGNGDIANIPIRTNVNVTKDMISKIFKLKGRAPGSGMGTTF